MNQALRRLLRKGRPSVEAVDRFIGANTFPLIDQTAVTFVYRGEADDVSLRCWVYGLPAVQKLQRLGESDLWALVVELPEDSRIEYKLEVVRNGHGEWIVDPLNPIMAEDPFGANSVCQGYGYERPEWTLEDVNARTGEIEEIRIKSRAFRDTRPVKLYIPARFRRSRRYPMLIAHDGDDYLKFSAFQRVLDNLIHRHEIPAMIVAFTQSPERLKEYAADPRQASFISEELLPAVQERLPLLDDPRSRGLIGASFGAVAALHAAWSFPGRFDRLLLQSGSFAFSDIGHHQRGPLFDPVVRFMNEFRSAPRVPAQQLYLSCGVYESLIYENRSLVPLLQSHGMDVRYEEVRDGHNWDNWRDRLRAGLSWLFPGPLWMVYD